MDVFSKEALIAAIADGARPRYVFFWSHKPRRPGMGVGAHCLSQWFPAPFTIDGARYATAEHFMMAEKARLFGDEEALARILAADEPGAAKALGRAVRGFDQEIWAARRFEIVRRGAREKFGQDPALKAYLAGTAARVLVEASPRDAIWGAGLARDHPDVERPETWPGLNLLGFALMAARADLRDGAVVG